MKLFSYILCFSCFYFNCVFSQVKYEKEYRIKNDEIPDNIKSYLNTVAFKNKIKWYKEEGLSKYTYEAKTSHDNLNFSIEFDSLGIIEDVEFKIEWKSVPELTKKNIVFNFRNNDILNDGQGAPLTPVFHHLMAIQNKISLPVCFLNIGGISNITIVKNKNDFKNVFYAGSHDACLLAVLNNQSDVCGMSSRNFEARLEDGTFKKEDVRIIHKSDRVPPPPLAYSKMIPREDRDAIKKAVLDAHNHGEIGGYGGKMSHYMEVKDSDYNVLRDVIELLNKNKS